MPGPRHITPLTKRCAAAIAIVAGLGAFIGLQRSDAFATPPPTATPGAAPAAPSPAIEPESAATAATATPDPDPTTATLVFTTIPAVRATVTWGKTRLGLIAPRRPLIVERPRDSGPLDVIVRAPGYLPVHTRAHTFADGNMVVKLTPIDQKDTLLGYRAPIDAGPPALPDGGVPPELADVPISQPAPMSSPYAPPLQSTPGQSTPGQSTPGLPPVGP